MQHFPLRLSGRRILNYLEDWLILAQSLDTLISHIDFLLIHLEPLGLCVNMQRAFSPLPLARSRGDESPHRSSDATKISSEMLPLVLWEIREDQWCSSPRTSLGSQIWRNCWRHRLGWSPAGSICYPRWTARCGTRTWNYGAIMCDRFRGIRGDGRLTVSHARKLMGARTPSTRRCMVQMGSVCERVRLISTRLLAPYRMFWVSRCTNWIVDRYHRHWSLCRGHCRVRSPQLIFWMRFFWFVVVV